MSILSWFHAYPTYPWIDWIAPLAIACNECGSLVDFEEHDAMCINGWIEDILDYDPDYTDNSTDLPQRRTGFEPDEGPVN